MADKPNRLVLIGNGFDLAHGLKTSYSSFLEWYLKSIFDKYFEFLEYEDHFCEIVPHNANNKPFPEKPITFALMIEYLTSPEYTVVKRKSNLLVRLLEQFGENRWVDIEHHYFRILKSIFKNPSTSDRDRKASISLLNKDFSHIILKLEQYIHIVNQNLRGVKPFNWKRFNIGRAFEFSEDKTSLKFLNFNYTETLRYLKYAASEDIIHIHGRAADSENSPLIFGYGDETDSAYQQMEDTGENMYLEHIKSFGYFKTEEYRKMLSYIDSSDFEVFVIGHSCGLSDRVLLNQIFEHKNCKSIRVFFHARPDGSDNFKEITQEISRHFKPENKDLMRRRLFNKNTGNIIPQMH